MVYEISIMRLPSCKDGTVTKIGVQEFYSDTVYTYKELGEISLDEIIFPKEIQNQVNSLAFLEIQDLPWFYMVR